MSSETLLFHALLAAGLLPLAVGLWRRGPRVLAVAVALLWAGVAGWVASGWHFAGTPQPPAADRPLVVEDQGYVSSTACRACHPEHYGSWYASYHRTMTQAATPETVVAPFDGRTVTFDDRSYTLTREGDAFFVEMPDPDAPNPGGPRVRKQVVMTTGSHNEQDFWYSTGEERSVRRVPIIYRIAEERWLPNESVFMQPPAAHHGEDPMPVSEWNMNCVKCHSTHGRPGFLMDGTPAANTLVAELGIACEACHGPAHEHVTANGDPLHRYAQHFSDERDATIVDPADLTPALSSVVCGQCHSITGFDDVSTALTWRREGSTYRPGGTLEEAGRFLARASEAETSPSMQQKLRRDPRFLIERFWDDGTVRVSGREYNGLIESPCYRDGSHADDMSCLSCHTLHKTPADPRSFEEWRSDQLGPGMEGDQGCLQCHADIEDDLEAHTHHAPDSIGSRCYDCHMPHTTFGLLKGIRSHRVDSPDVGKSQASRIPNACNLCHLEQSRAWTAGYLTEWYDQPLASTDSPLDHLPAGLAWALQGDAGIRALAAWHMGWDPAQKTAGTEWMGRVLSELLVDPYDAVRFNAGRSLGSLEGFEDFEYDFVGDKYARGGGRRRALQRLDQLGLPSEWDALFPDVDESTIDELQRARDQSPVHLRE